MLSAAQVIQRLIRKRISKQPEQRSGISKRLQDGRPTFRGSIAGWSNIFLLRTVHNGCRVHPTSYSKGTGGCSLEIKRPGPKSDYRPPLNAEV